MIGLLEIRRRKLQFALIGVVVALISYLVLMINALGVGLNEQAGSALRSFDADAIAYTQRSDLSLIRSEMGQETVDAVLAVAGVEEGAPVGYVAANAQLDDGEVRSAAFLGYDPGSIAEPPVTDGDPLTEQDADAILADKSFLRQTGLDVGDTVTISFRLSERDFLIKGEIDEGNFFFQPTVYLLRSTWQELKYGAPAADTPVASVVLLQGDDLPGTEGDGFEIVSKSTAFANIEGVSGQQSTVVALRVFGYIIGAMVIGVFFYVLTLQRTAQIGVLKAVGASSFYVFRQVLLQVLIVTVIALAVALPLAWLTARGLQNVGSDGVPVAFTTGTFITTSVAILITGLVGAAFSGKRVAGVDPIIALGQQQ